MPSKRTLEQQMARFRATLADETLAPELARLRVAKAALIKALAGLVDFNASCHHINEVYRRNEAGRAALALARGEGS